MDKREQAQQAAMEFANTMASIFSDEKPKQEQPDLTSKFLTAGRLWSPQQEPEQDPYQEAVQVAMQKMSESEGFVLVVAGRRDDGLLEPHAMGFSKSPQAELAIEAHMAGVTARAHQELALQTLSHMEK